MSSKGIHVVAGVRASFLFFFKAESYSVEWTDRVLFIPSSVLWHLGCLHFLALRSSAIVKMFVQIFMWTCVFNSFGSNTSSY